LGVEAANRYRGVSHPELRKVPPPARQQLLEDVATMSMCAVGRKYGVSDNAVRKWLRWYEPRLRSEGDAI
jgi:transposase-like protein